MANTTLGIPLISQTDADKTASVNQSLSAVDALIASRGVSEAQKRNLDRLQAPTPAQTAGQIVRKIEVFDALGQSLGFVPVYDSIT